MLYTVGNAPSVEQESTAQDVVDSLNAITQNTAFNKQIRDTALFEVSGADLRTAQAVVININNTPLVIDALTMVTLPALNSTTDYKIYCDQSGALAAQPWDDAAPANSRVLGGFHVYHTTGTINTSSLWDQTWRPSCSPRGMTLAPGGLWTDIYLMHVDYGIDGYSKGNAIIADGSSPPKIPVSFGGDGAITYGSLTWYEACDLASAAGKRLPGHAEFSALAYGVVEQQSVGGDPVTTQYQAGPRSACGAEQCAGVMWQWGADINGTSATGAPSWQSITDGRGSVYMHSLRAVRLGASWYSGSSSGSRASGWSDGPNSSASSVGARAVCDRLIL